MSFDRLAPHFGWMELALAGDKLQRMRTGWLNVLPPVRRALLAGEGHGRFLVELRRRQPSVEIVCLDSSAPMLSVARRRLERAGLLSSQVSFVAAGLPSPAVIAGEFDLVVTHFFLDCFPPGPLASVIEQLARAATTDAHWLVADFRTPERGFARLRARWILALMYGFFRLLTHLPARSLTPPDPFLAAHGFRLRARQMAEWGLLHTDWWQRATSAGPVPSPNATKQRLECHRLPGPVLHATRSG